MAYSYNIKDLQQLLTLLLTKNLDDASQEWVEKQEKRFRESQKMTHFNLTFTAIPRFIPKSKITISEKEEWKLDQIRSGINLKGWETDRLVRTWWLLQLSTDEKTIYVNQLEGLFKAAEMNEQVALYGALPLLAYPKAFVRQAAVGVRTNMKNVFDAIVLDNPFPYEYMEDPAWNQMVLKAFFMERPVNRIIGLDKRANRNLAYILSDYAHERWAAGRPVNPLLWRPVSPFIDKKLFLDIQKLFQSAEEKEKQAAALACFYSNYARAKTLLKDFGEIKHEIEKENLTWETLG